MTRADFYTDLSNAQDGTMELGGMVLLNKNKGKWHLCKKRPTAVSHACGSGGPRNPNRTSSLGKNYSVQQFEKSTELTTPQDALEKSRVCSHCERIIESEFDLTRLVFALTDDEKQDVKRFVNRRTESLK